MEVHGAFSCSLQDKLGEGVRNIYALLVFYDSKNSPIDVAVVNYDGLIPPGLAKRVKGKVDGSVQRLTTRGEGVKPTTEIEVRVLDFEIVN